MSGLPKAPRRTIVAGLVVAGLVVPTTGFAAYQHDRGALKQLPSRTVIGTVEVSGMTRSEAVVAVRRSVVERLDRVATLQVGSRSITVRPRDIGVKADAVEAVDTAFAAARHGSWLSRSWQRLKGDTRGTTLALKVTDPVETELQKVVARAAREVDIPAIDASVKLIGSFVHFTPATPGRGIDRQAAVAALKASLRDGKPRRVDPRTTAPDVTDEAFETVVLVHANANKLYLYRHGKIAKTYGVATGLPSYPTPVGRFEVTLKRFMPTWVNPHPYDGWGKNLPKVIKPGASNPLGLRALNISAPAIRIHGTPASRSIGYNASHGCIRMRNSDVVDLFPRVPKGATVFITRVGSPRLMGSTAKPKPKPSGAPVAPEDVQTEGG